MGVSGSKETDLFILTAQSKVDELGKGRRIVLPQSGALSKPTVLKSASQENGRQEAAPGGPGASANMAAPATRGPDSTEPTGRAQVHCPSDLAAPVLSALWTGRARGWRRGPTLRRHCARCLLAPGLRGQRAMPDRAPPGRGAIMPSLGECPPRAVLLTLPWPAASLAPRPGRCRYR